jgi:hypothetical protein
VDEAAWWFISIDRCCQSQLLAGVKKRQSGDDLGGQLPISLQQGICPVWTKDHQTYGMAHITLFGDLYVVPTRKRTVFSYIQFVTA